MNENVDVNEDVAAKKAVAIEAAEHWIMEHPEQNRDARADLIKMLSVRPHDAADFGDFRVKYDIPKPVGAWLSLQCDIVKQGHAPYNEKRIMYYLPQKENDTGYWNMVDENASHRLPSAEAKNRAHSFCTSDKGRKIADWLRDDLKDNGPINWSVFGVAHFLPVGVPVGMWLSDPLMDFVNAVPQGGGRDYCELKELSPDSRPIRTRVDFLPEWIVDKPRTLADVEPQLEEDVPLVVSKPFFVGKVHFKKSPFGFTRKCVVTDVISATQGTVADITIRANSSTWEEGEFVVGLIPMTTDPFLFANQSLNSPVQILKWKSFKESQAEPFAKAYFLKAPNGALTATSDNLIGNNDRPGHIIIADEDGGYLKGFSSIGNGCVRYSNVERYDGDFLLLSSANQVTEMIYKGLEFAMLVPEPENKYQNASKHAVMDCEGWVPLLTGPDETVMQIPEEPSNKSRDNSANATAIDGAHPQVTEVSERNSVVSPTIEKRNALVESDPNERAFVSKFIRVAKESGFEYDPRDLVRFHTCMKIGGFTVLGGSPGCGKSSLVALYARALLGKKTPESGDGYLTIDVSPSWMEPEDVLGHWGLKGPYVVSQTGLVEFLRKAASDEGFATTPIVCLEEMNLARVEHYFADFMQQLCRDEKERVLKGVPKDSSQEEPSLAELPLSPLLRFVGTNNFDETTQRFSQRFYDRCNYIELSSARSSEPFSCGVPSFRADFGPQVDCKVYESWFNKEPSHDILEPAVVDKYKSLTEVFKNVNLPVSRRAEVAILVYIANRPFLPECGDDSSDRVACQMRALDEVIAQKILSRYTGNSYGGDVDGEEQLKKKIADLPLSRELVKNRSKGRERPSRL